MGDWSLLALNSTTPNQTDNIWGKGRVMIPTSQLENCGTEKGNTVFKVTIGDRNRKWIQSFESVCTKCTVPFATGSSCTGEMPLSCWESFSMFFIGRGSGKGQEFRLKSE